MLCRKKKKKKKKKKHFWDLPKYFWEVDEQHCIIFMALASASKIMGTQENIFGEPLRQQGSTDIPRGPLWDYQAFRLQQFDYI